MLTRLSMGEQYRYFLEALKKELEERELSQAALSKMVGVSSVHINMVLKGKRNAGQGLQGKIIDALGVDGMEFIAKGYRLVNGTDPVEVEKVEVETPTEAPPPPDANELLNTFGKMYKKTEESLHSLQSVLENLGDAVVIMDADLIIEYQNKAHRELFSGNMLGEKCSFIGACGDNDGRCACMKAIETNLVQRETVKYRERLIEICATPRQNHAGVVTGVISTIRDITDRHRIIEESEKLADICQCSLEKLDRAVVVCDEDLNVIFHNTRVTEITGASEEDLKTVPTFREYLIREDIIQNADEVFATGDRARKEKKKMSIVAIRRDGKKFLYTVDPIKSEGKTKFSGFTTTITPIKEVGNENPR